MAKVSGAILKDISFAKLWSKYQKEGAGAIFSIKQLEKFARFFYGEGWQNGVSRGLEFSKEILEEPEEEDEEKNDRKII